MNGKLTQAEISKTLDFCLNAFQQSDPGEREAVLQKLEDIEAKKKVSGNFEANFTDDEQRLLKTIRARQMLRTEDIIHIDNFSADTIDGFTPNVQRGSLGLVKAMVIPEVKDHVNEEQIRIPIKAY